MTNKYLYLGFLHALNVLFVVGLPSVRIWPNDSRIMQMGSGEKYYCKIEGVHDFFVNSPTFFQVKGTRLYMQNSTKIEKDSALLSKTFEMFDEDTEIFCLWKPVKTKGDVFPLEILSQRVAIRFRQPAIAEETCTCDTWWQWVIAIAAAIVIILIVIVIVFCRRTKKQMEQLTPNIQQEPSYSYATAPVMSFEDARALAANNRPLPRYQTMVPKLPPRDTDRAEYEYIEPELRR